MTRVLYSRPIYILGVTIQLKVSTHVENLTEVCSRFMFALTILGAHGFPDVYAPLPERQLQHYSYRPTPLLHSGTSPKKRQSRHWKNLKEAEADGFLPRRCTQYLNVRRTSKRKTLSFHRVQFLPDTLTTSSFHSATTLKPPYTVSQFSSPLQELQNLCTPYLYNLKSKAWIPRNFNHY